MVISFRIVMLFLFVSLLTIASNGNKKHSANLVNQSPPNCEVISKTNFDDCIRMNQIQVFGTHNSYKQFPHPDLIEKLNEYNQGWADNINYQHRPLREQLEELMIRQFEMDIFADPSGGRYAEPAGALLINDNDFIRPPAMMEPGYKVLHTQDIDYRSSCLTFKLCLSEIRQWSIDNPSHMPIMILVEVKQGVIEGRHSMEFTVPLIADEELLNDIDIEIWEIFSKEHVIIPDDVRGDYETLEEAILKNGWPNLRETRGKIIFALDNTDETIERYISNSPNLENRVMFVSTPPGEPTSAFIKMNNSIDNYELIKERVAAGYIVRTRTDIPLQEAKSGDMTRLNAALSSGAQFLSTDFPEPSPYDSKYKTSFPDTDGVGRCNPVNSPSTCKNKFIIE